MLMNEPGLIHTVWCYMGRWEFSDVLTNVWIWQTISDENTPEAHLRTNSRWPTMLYPSQHIVQRLVASVALTYRNQFPREFPLIIFDPIWSKYIFFSVFLAVGTLWLWFPAKPPPSRRSCHQASCHVRFKFKCVYIFMYIIYIYI